MAVPLLGALTKGATLQALFRGLTDWAIKWIGPIIVQTLAFFGISMFVLEWGIGPMTAALSNAMSGAPATFVQVIAYVGGDVAMSMILSAYVVRASGRVLLQRSAP